MVAPKYSQWKYRTSDSKDIPVQQPRILAIHKNCTISIVPDVTPMRVTWCHVSLPRPRTRSSMASGFNLCSFVFCTFMHTLHRMKHTFGESKSQSHILQHVSKFTLYFDKSLTFLNKWDELSHLYNLYRQLSFHQGQNDLMTSSLPTDYL